MEPSWWGAGSESQLPQGPLSPLLEAQVPLEPLPHREELELLASWGVLALR